jgi:DNA-binding SARP family transcriptional activator
MAKGDLISLDLEDCLVDALQVEAAMLAGLETLSSKQLRSLDDLFAGDFLDGLDLNRSPQLDHWVASQRRRYRACHAAILEQLTRTLSNDPRELRSHVERWVEISPIDARAQILLLKTLLECGSASEAERHFAATVRLFEAEDADVEPIRRAWHELRKQKPSISPGEPAVSIVTEAAGHSESVDVILPARHRRAYAPPGLMEGGRIAIKDRAGSR